MQRLRFGMLLIVSLVLIGCGGTEVESIDSNEHSVEWLAEDRIFESQSKLTLSFQVESGNRYKLYVLYEDSGTCKTIEQTAGWKWPDKGVVSWSWHTDAMPQSATALVRRLTDSSETWHSFHFEISEPKPGPPS